MKTSDAWRLSAIPYSEMAFRSILQNSSNMWWGSFGRGTETQEQGDLVKRALRIARFDKVVLALFVTVAAGAPFYPQVLGAAYGLSASVTLSLAVSFALIVLYGMQTLSSFVTGGPSPVLATLPLVRSDVSLVNLLSLVRTSDFPIVGSVACQVFFVALLGGSAVSGLLMLLVGVANSALAVSVSLWLSRIFYRDVVGSRRSRGGGALRLVLLSAWGIVVVGIGVLFAAAGYLIPLVQGALANPGGLAGPILSLVYPFSLGVSVGATTHLSAISGVEGTALAATAGYLLVTVAASRWSASAVANFQEGASPAPGIGRAPDTRIGPRGPVVAYLVKDLRMASVNLPSAFLFALPTFETIVVLLYRAGLPTLRASTLLVSTVLGGMVSLILPLVLISSEGAGFDFAKSMPVRMRTIVLSKSLFATAIYVPAVAATYVQGLLKPLASPTSSLIPLASVLAVAAASSLEVRLFLGFAPAGRATFAIQEFGRLAAGAILVILPATIFAMTYVLTLDHALAAIGMLAVASSELIAVIWFVRRN
jgi:hypothetical protein